MSILPSDSASLLSSDISSMIDQLNQFGANQIPFIFIVNFDLDQGYLSALSKVDPERVWIDFPLFSNTPYPVQSNQVKLIKKPISYLKYQQAFAKVMVHLECGNSFLTNLTASTPIELSGSMKDLFFQANAPYKVLFDEQWVCFSPETFIQISGHKIYSFPMKGTIDAAIPNAQKVLLDNQKETAEHHTIVDLIRNDLNKVSTKVKVEKFRYIQHIKTSDKDLLQVSSKISGELPKGYEHQLGHILMSLLPAGSISGAPKVKTTQIIREAEDHTRGFYTGVCFISDGVTIDSCVLIRFIEKIRSGYLYKSGGGITIHSTAEQEYKELNDKIYVPIF